MAAETYARLDAARSFLAAREEVDHNRIGVTGFCMGGICPVAAGYGGLDRPFVEQGRTLQKHLASLGIAHDVKIYEGVGHGNMNDHGDGLLTALARRGPMHAAYDEGAAEDSWRRILAFFGEHL